MIDERMKLTEEEAAGAGINHMSDKERAAVEYVTQLAMHIRDGVSHPFRKQELLIDIAVELLKEKRKGNPSITEDVYQFCMTWIAGAITFNADERWKMKSIISFLAGAATVAAYWGMQ